MENFGFDQEKIEKAAALLRAVSHHLRLKILRFIHQKKETKVGDIYRTMQIEQSITSQHLKILRGVDVVRTRRDGKKIFYSINYDRLEAMNAGINLFDQIPAKKAVIKKK